MRSDENRILDIRRNIIRGYGGGDGKLIQPPKIIPVEVKRNLEYRGLEKPTPYKIGHTYYIIVDSLRALEFRNPVTGETFSYPIVNTVDANGRDRGWIFAEALFL